jgi:DNA-binding transcriptional LysR family regulator
VDLLLHLRGFVAVADELSVSRAAELLAVDQPLLSRRIRALEAHLDTQLVDRSRRQIALTEAGTALVPRARSLLDQAAHLVDDVAVGTSCRFGLTVPRSIEPAALARLVRLLRDQRVDAVVSSEDDHAGAPESGWWVERTAEQAADWTVDLGVVSNGQHAIGDRGSLWLGELRPRRGRPARELLITEDDDPSLVDTVRQIADRSGMSPRLVRRTTSEIAYAELLADRAMIITSRRTADRDKLAWTRLADPGMQRWFRLIERAPIPESLVAGELRDRVLTMLGIVLGAELPPNSRDDHARQDHWGRP